MNFYLTIASTYFQTFEGRQLLPNWKNWRWYAWVVTLISFVWCFSYWIVLNSQNAPYGARWWAFVAEGLFLAVSFEIGMFKRKQLLASLPAYEMSENQRIEKSQRQKLEELLGCQSAQFLLIAKEIEDLSELEREYKSGPQLQVSDIGRHIYDPDSKARLLSIALTAIAIFVTFLARSVDAPLFTVFEIVAEIGFLKILGSAFAISILLLGLTLGLQKAAGEFLEIFKNSAASVLLRQRGGRTELNYLVRDLIKHHERSRLST